jgi:hypothetical protein
MLLRFGVENHGSIAPYQELQLTATSLKDDDTGVMIANGASVDRSVHCECFREFTGERLR